MNCERCSHFGSCSEPCIFVELLLAKKTSKLKEHLMDVDLDQLLVEDYKDVLSKRNGSNGHTSDSLSILAGLPESGRDRAVAIMSVSGMDNREISSTLGISERSVYRILARIKGSRTGEHPAPRR